MVDAENDALDPSLEEAIREFALGEEPREDDDASVGRVVDSFAGDRRGRGWHAPAVVAGIAAAAAFVLWFAGEGPSTEQPPAPVIAASPETPPPPEAAMPASEDGFRVVSGQFDVDGVRLAVDQIVAANTVVRSGGAGCLAFAGTRLCAEGPSRLVVEDSRLRLEEGGLVVQVPEPVVAPAIETARGRIEPHPGEHRVSVEVPEGTNSTDVVVIVAVIAGTATVTEPDSTVHELTAPDTLTLGRPADAGGEASPGPDAVPSAAALLERAQAQRAAGQGKQAAKTYRMLIRHHADSKEARNALVSLGQLEIDLGRPGPAITAFDQYLRQGGLLAEEARFGRIRALQKRGDRERERVAIEEFVRKHPESPYRKTLEDRLAEKSD